MTMTIGFAGFNTVDIVIMVLLLIGGIGGAITGFAISFSRTAGYVAGLFLALAFTTQISAKLAQTFTMKPVLSSLCAFLLLFIIGYVLLAILGSTLEKIFQLGSGLEALNRILGFFWSMLLMFFIIVVICYFLKNQTLWNVKDSFSQSQFITRLIDPLTPNAEKLITKALQ
ncbi:MAG: CvpA family protein [Sphaerochaeta sp.]|jgi:membrane protein required for colicin V production|nr:CvpA family protein [Sphaerochaeta sp.]MCH3921038.1 CvpA family protein [Sphaerochaeta sp.]MCI2045411.1 CvpA family protein [Sphaerochaeta sp.]MCI2076901.1 CvpA family protein [Sphaerochaeta sp.]MCI2097069.1 CvpA family protein [Sphaerochaeta sp.]